MFKKLLIPILIAFLSVSVAAPAFAAAKKTVVTKPFEKIFYYVPGVGPYATLQMYGTQIPILAPQVYQVDANGNLTGGVSAITTAITVANKTKVMPLVFQQNFDPTVMHTLLSNYATENTFADELVSEAVSKGYIGWQFDFEHVMATDRDAYSGLVELVASKLHAKGLILSVAVVARTSDNPSDLPAGSWDNWAGVFDYARIGKAADFISLMAYDQPASTGSVASLPWIKKTVAYAEKHIPKSKISLGIPTYGWEWNTDTNTMVKSVSNDLVNELVVNKKYDKMGYDGAAQSAWITYTDTTGATPIHYKIWYQDVRSFKVGLALAKSQKLRGISVWVVGMEDPAIWSVLK